MQKVVDKLIRNPNDETTKVTAHTPSLPIPTRAACIRKGKNYGLYVPLTGARR